MHHHEDVLLSVSSREIGSSVMTDSPDGRIRAGHADREAVSDRLIRAVNDGRLGLTEYDCRLQLLYAAETYGELAEIVADLPRPDARPKPKQQRKQAIPGWVVIMWMPWAAVNVLCFAIWLATGGGYFWPFWVAVPWGCALWIPTAIGVLAERRSQTGTGRTHGCGRLRSHGAQ